MAMPVWPVGTKTLARPRRRASRSSSRQTVILPSAQSVPTVGDTCASTVRLAPVGTSSPAGGRRRSRISTPVLRGRRGELGVVAEEVVQAALDVQPGARSPRRIGRPPVVGQLAAGRRDADQQRVRPQRQRLVDAGHHRHVRVEAGHVVAHACCRPGWSRSPPPPGRRRSAARRWRSWRRARRSRPRPGSRSRLTATAPAAHAQARARRSAARQPSREAEPLERVVGVQQVAVEVDDVDQRRQLRGRGDAQARLVHAAQHHRQAERAGGVDHALRLADAARLGQLDVDAVGEAAGAGRRRAACGSSRRARSGSAAQAACSSSVALDVAGVQRLLDQLDVQRHQLRADLAW